jgi:hypothetical protein
MEKNPFVNPSIHTQTHTQTRGKRRKCRRQQKPWAQPGFQHTATFSSIHLSFILYIPFGKLIKLHYLLRAFHSQDHITNDVHGYVLPLPMVCIICNSPAHHRHTTKNKEMIDFSSSTLLWKLIVNILETIKFQYSSSYDWFRRAQSHNQFRSN